MEAFFLVRSLDMKDGDFGTVTFLDTASIAGVFALLVEDCALDPGRRLEDPELTRLAVPGLSLVNLFVAIDTTFSRRCLPGLLNVFIARLVAPSN